MAPSAPGADREPGTRQHRGGTAPSHRPAARAALGIVVVALVPIVGLGWLYLLHRGRVLGAGPAVGGALPLQQLAGGEAQPLLRVLAVWAPAGVVAGLLLAALTGWTRRTRGAVVAAVFAVMLVLAGAGSDAAAISQSLPSHVPAQAGRAATWLAVVVGAGFAMLPRGASPQGRRGSTRGG